MADNRNNDKSGRFENKYRISLQSYLALRNAITPHMRADRYTRLAGRDGYFVRSLYYETLDYAIYSQKMAGDCDRVKYRLRSYTADSLCKPAIRVEMKVRRGESLSKYHTFVDYSLYSGFITKRHWGEEGNDVLEEFSRGVYLACLQPCVLIDYNREGYESRYGDGVRLTFDHSVRSTQAKNLFPEPKPFFRIHHTREVVLEIKYKSAPPAWLRGIVQGHGLRLVANSKFTQGIEAGCRERCNPDGILVVR